MTAIEHYVLSSRKIGKQGDSTTYLEKEDIGRRAADRANNHFNIGKYSIAISPDASHRENFHADLPEFITLDDYSEAKDFTNYPDSDFHPGTDFTAIFDEVFSELQQTDKLLYIYLHGFGNDAQKEKNKQVIPMTEAFAPHEANASTPVGKMIFLTWPSQGFLQYKHGEKEDVSKMANMVAVFLLKLRNYVKNKRNPLFITWEPKIVFHAQSMGNKILLGAVNRINFLEGANVVKQNILDKFFYRIVMTGADVDLDALNDEPDTVQEEVHQWAQRVILFYNKKDRALWISRFIFLSGKRLGRHLDDETIKALPKNIDLVELHGNGRDVIGHNYFTEQPQVAVHLQKALTEHHFDGIALEPRARRMEYYIEENRFESEYLG